MARSSADIPSRAPVRILVVSHNYPRFPGDPAGAFVHRIAAGCAAEGHDVAVVAPHAPGLATRETVDGVLVERFRYAPESWERIAYSGDLHRRPVRRAADLVALPGFAGAFAAAVRRAVRRGRPDVVHAHWWLPGGVAAVLGARRVPLIVTSHGSDVRLLGLPGGRHLARLVLGRAQAITTVSAYLRDELVRAVPAAAATATVAPMPLDVDRFLAAPRPLPTDPPRLLYAGNLVPSKNVDVLLRAVAAVLARGVACRLRILGEGPLEADLRALAASLGIDGAVEWLPFVPQDRMPAEYAAAAVTALPSRAGSEGLGLTLAEALLAGSAVVGTRAGGIPEVVDHEVTGLLVPDGDPGALATALERLLTDSGLRQRLTDAGRARVQRTYAPGPAIARFLDLYHAAVDRARR